MPTCARSNARRDKRFSPMNVIVPASGGTTPLIVLNNVDFPAPFGPTRVTNLPSATDSVTLVNARRPPYATERSRTSSMLTGQPFLSEIGLDHRGILDDGARQSCREHAAVVQHHEPIGEAHHRVHGVLDDA